jgi:hypothetical protein
MATAFKNFLFLTAASGIPKCFGIEISFAGTA